jgi:SAM-dependent MidA family methyltransferase
VLGPVTQGDFLRYLGIATRMQTLLNNTAAGLRRKELLLNANRLVDPKDMGVKFKVLGLNCSAGVGFA